MTRISKTDPLTVVKDYRIRYQSTLGEVSRFFLDMVNKGKIMGTRCGKCGKTYVPPYPNCPDCLSKTDWVEMPNNGVIETFTVCYAQPYHFKHKLPYVVAYVRLEGADTMLPGIVDADPSKVQEGSKVTVRAGTSEKGSRWGVYDAGYHFELSEG
jgi:uncharacterized OB-fold protein